MTLVSLGILHVHLDEVKLLLQSRYLTLRLVLVKRLLGYKLSSKVLNLESILLLDGFILFAHDISPNDVELIQYSTYASLTKIVSKFILDFLDNFDSFSRNPFISITIFLGLHSGGSLVWLNPKGLANISNTLLTEIFSLSHDFSIG